ncbi:hypothetical protein [Dasania marina]|uniref:hypothetical protein n=1 Tax=Dasania marina TaxID=471499 RepID=UPI000373CA7D|nr:hypothetical protein [Dasania marina]
MSKPVLIRLVIISFLAIVAGLFVYTDRQEAHYQATAPDQISAMLQDIDSWQAADLSQHLSSAAKSVVSPQQLSNVLDLYRPLGQFERIEELHFSRLASALSLLGTRYISYSGIVQYSRGHAELTITLVHDETAPDSDKLKISNINMSSPALGL